MSLKKVTKSQIGLWSDAIIRDEPIDLLTYARDASVVKPGEPDCVVRPTNTKQIRDILSGANRDGVSVYVRGAGTMYAGGANPHAGGLVIDLSGMDSILDIDLVRGVIVVEAGTRFGSVLEMLKPLKQTLGVVPLTGPTATIGGAVSSHALGTGSPRSQSMGDCVAGLEVVLPDGTLVRTGSAACKEAGFFQRYCIGPDLTGLFIGADATFGIITAVCLWLYPDPSRKETFCVGFDEAIDAGSFVSALQGAELTRNIWYGSGYEEATINSKILVTRPETDVSALPKFCFGLELGGQLDDIIRDKNLILEEAEKNNGTEFQAFNDAYFHKLRQEETYWYSFAGYFTLSRCALLMCSLPTDRLDNFVGCIQSFRTDWPDFVWGGAVVLCRRGLHGGIVTFYDENTQWDSVLLAVEQSTKDLISAGCVPYKSGKIWDKRSDSFPEFQHLLKLIKRGIDPGNIMSPGNLGL